VKRFSRALVMRRRAAEMPSALDAFHHPRTAAV
jgi:hypothetical protein